MQYKCLTIKSPIDARDLNAQEVFKKLTIPDILDLRKDLNIPRDQGSQGTCAAQTAAAMKEYQEKKDINFQFIHNLQVTESIR